MLTILRAATLITEIMKNGQAVPFDGVKQLDEAIAVAVDNINMRSYGQVLRTCDAVLRERAQQTQFDDLGVDMYCEDSRLSSNRMDGMYRSIVVPGGLPTLADEDREDLLDLFLGHFDIDYVPGNPWDRKPGSKKKNIHHLWEEAQQRQTRHRRVYMPDVQFVTRLSKL